MKRKFAVPLENGVLCSHFGHCTQFAFIDTDGNTVLSETLATPPPHEPGILPLWLYGEQVTDIIAGGMGQHAQSILVQNGIKVHMGAPQKSAKALVEDCLNDILETGANQCDH
ncbi:hypothetical protein SDC9_45247 [bioreactor metagenome]|jgi:predicted Fe-Mo cluster-binding NifX family protein|uniref:Dinitrogenase iron-molybdenum cofactor biosynthesis domain-containing protein n=1 Tax=bioreactor metagenome TaxID=1076179 RepID=A0A644W9C6_9ZZZZ|nr:NifB/NifX family molybdenum-iron cluster-binding protein [Bacteroidales bacterium MB20-C3-3]